MNKLNKRQITILLFLICTLQLVVSIFIGSKKNFLFFDEVFSYPAANNVESIGYEFNQNQWMDSTWFDNYMGVGSEHRFDYAIPYNNQVTDVHPPLFYFFLHTASSLVPDQFSMWAGLAFNMVFFVISVIALYFLGKEVFGNLVCGLLTAFLYGISYGGLNTYVYIRMYMLMTMMALLHIRVYLKYFEQEKVPVKGYIFLVLTMVGGVLSQYYFLFVAFALGLWYGVKFILEKKYQTLIKYLGTVAASAMLSLLIWPSMIRHLFAGGRGKEAQGNLLAFGGFFSDLKEMVRIVNNEMFTNLLLVVLAGMILLEALGKWKKCSVSKGRIYKISVILFVTVMYLLLVTKLAPYQVERYVMPIYPLVYLLVVGGCVQLLANLIPMKFAATLCIVGFGGLSAVHILLSGVPFTYEKNMDNIERFAVVEEYGDGYALYISDNGECHEFYSSQMLRHYKAFYHVYDLNTVETVKDDMQKIQGEESIVVYVSKTNDMEAVNGFVKEVFGDASLDDENHLDEDQDWNVYLLKL